ncbi:MAG: ATP-binding protein, partial [Spirochaetota bacterium]|nr:ATP-binding protein [Spirochaetota bacterium]
TKILEMLFKHSLDCIVLLDKDFNFIRVNEAYARSCQKNVLDFPGHNHFEFYPSILLKEFEEVVKTHKHYEAFSRPFTFPDHPEWGVTYWDLSLVPVINDKNDIELLVFTLRDVTDRKLAEDEKDKIQAQLVQSQKMEAIGSLSGGIAHDFNNLLTPLLGYTKLLMAKIDKNDGKFYYLNEINSASERAAHITQSLLLFSRKQTTKYSTININNQINSIYDMINYTIGENIVIEKELEKNLYNIQGNGSCIDQIIMNLAINSKKAMEHGGKIVIKTENLHINDYNKKKPPGDYVCLSVMDTGKGFDEQIKEQIFEPFFTTDNSGSGFGLYIVKCIVQQHNGWIDVQSTLNKGTTFKFFFPASFEDLVSVDKQLLFSNELRGNGEKILLVEDEKIVLNFAALALRDYGYTIYEATNSKEAEEIFKNEGGNFHLIFSDVILPDKIATFMIEDFLSLNNNIKILLTSGYIEDESQWYKIVQKKYHFLQKPYNLIDLLSIIKNIIHSKEKIYGTMQ